MEPSRRSRLSRVTPTLPTPSGPHCRSLVRSFGEVLSHSSTLFTTCLPYSIRPPQAPLDWPRDVTPAASTDCRVEGPEGYAPVLTSVVHVCQEGLSRQNFLSLYLPIDRSSVFSSPNQTQLKNF